MTTASPASAGRLLAIVGIVGALAATSGCSFFAESEPSPTPSSSASDAAEPAALQPDGDAADNRPFFDEVNARTADGEVADGRHFVDALVDAGFDREAMSLTSDTTSIGLEADAIEFAVRWGDECLIGQFSDSAGYHSTVSPTMAGERCLVGTTRPIDWE
ncbi:DUF6993 domain-containing protein [Mycetocola reblochoni]|uniref:DUF6993 domain-containing protein n=2 Tax=Mycetocola reblochoni TaxID=331618 RepID=A0A1R4JCZ5_9MICO|nr:hypothetical protein [Mycetocola reblochoni]RLP69952.1 hypothetical protein D9V30_04535 [Mycetocola reblochoni]SJN29906.1 hypothetical protein FM119_06855 [Mycetocola reblochoni REB411]